MLTPLLGCSAWLHEHSREAAADAALISGLQLASPLPPGWGGGEAVDVTLAYVGPLNAIATAAGVGRG